MILNENFPTVAQPSITIIDHTKPLSPIRVRIPPPSIFKTKLEEQRYRAKKHKIYLEGEHGLEGLFCYIVDECKIKDRNTQIDFRPTPRDIDAIMAEHVMKAYRKHNISEVIKTRGVGLSCFLGCVGTYVSHILNPGGRILITSKDIDGVGIMYDEKFMTTFKGLSPSIRADILAERNTKGNYYLKYGINHFIDGEETYTVGECFCRETSEKPTSPTNFSGKGAVCGLFDEWALHKRRKELARSSEECFQNTETKELIALVVRGGTVEDGLTPEDLSGLANEIRTAEKNKISVLFIPYWFGKFQTNGHSDIKKAQEWWERTCEEKSQTGDPNDLRAFKMNNPSCLEDIFDLAHGNRWEDDVADMIKLQHKLVSENPPPSTPAKIILMGNEVVKEPSKSKDAPFIFYEDCKPNVQYMQTVDGVATGTETGGEEGSNVSGLIIKLYDPAGGSYSVVSRYNERPTTVEVSYRNLVNQAKVYDKFGLFDGIMAEAAVGTADHFSVFLKSLGLAKWAMKTRDLSGKGNSNKNKPFQFVNNHTRSFQYRAANIFLRRFIQNIKCLPLLNDMQKAIDENTDDLDSWLMFFVAYPDINKLEQVIKPKKKAIQLPVRERNSRGELVTVWKEVVL